MKTPELTSSEINEACWAFVEAMPHQLPGPIFNDLKPAIVAAVSRYQEATAQPLPEHADHVSEIAARLRHVAKLAGCPQAVPENDHTAVGAIFSVLGNMRRAMERQERAGADAAIRLAPHLHIGACITEGRLHATVMHKAGNGPATVVAMAEMAVDALKEHDCIATMTPAASH